MEKGFLKLMNNAVFGKTTKNMRNHGNNKLVTTKRRRSHLVSGEKMFNENLLAIEMRKTQILIIHLGLSILDLSKTIMYEICYDFVKRKYSENSKLCYMDTESFIVCVKINDIYKDTPEDV